MEFINRILNYMMTRKELLIEYLEKYKKEVESGLLTLIGEGSMGVAYRYKDKVFKITSDYHDFIIALEGLKRNYDFFAKVYSVDVIECYDSYFYILEVEYCGETLNQKRWSGEIDNDFCLIYDEIFEVFTSNYFRNKPIYFKEVRESLIEIFGKDIYKSYKTDIKYLYSTFKKLEHICKRKELFYFDYHASNVCLVEGKLKVIDFGYSRDEYNTVKSRNKFFKTFKIKTLSK